MAFDSLALRRQFPLLSTQTVAYLDNAATTQKPQIVLDAMDAFYTKSNANVNRGVHALAERATVAYEDARKTVQKFINAKQPQEVIFVRGTTEAINLVAWTWGVAELKKGDAIALSVLEHHSNMVPWMQLKEFKQIEIVWLPVDADGVIDLKVLEEELKKKKIKLVSISGLSNVLGSLQPIKKMTELAHAHDAKVLVDAAQLIVHKKVDVAEMGCDFLAFSGHKVFGPTGIGVLYGREDLLNAMPPFMGGGDMIRNVSKEGFTTAELPRKFEAGTPAIAEAIGLGAAINWLNTIDRVQAEKHEAALMQKAVDGLSSIKGVTILGSTDSAKHTGCVSFSVKDVHPHDLTQVLSDNGVYLRAGHHCTQPLHKDLGLVASTRLSVAPYNTMDDIEKFLSELLKAIHKLRP